MLSDGLTEVSDVDEEPSGFTVGALLLAQVDALAGGEVVTDLGMTQLVAEHRPSLVPPQS
jgi:hypothetical protein